MCRAFHDARLRVGKFVLVAVARPWARWARRAATGTTPGRALPLLTLSTRAVLGFLAIVLKMWDYENNRMVEWMGMGWDMGPLFWSYQATYSTQVQTRSTN